jgi:hypothetical protein
MSPTQSANFRLLAARVWILPDEYQVTQKDRDRFAKNLVRVDDCLLWVGSITPRGYGQFKVGGRVIGAHIFAYFAEHFFNLPAEGQDQIQVAHSCRYELCCNPDHLRLTTRPVNLAERLFEREEKEVIVEA